MYTIYVVFDCLPDMREAFVQRVKADGILDAILKEDGCYGYDYYFSESDPNKLLLIERWETKQHQQVHIGQPHMAKLMALKEDYVRSTTLGEFHLD